MQFQAVCTWKREVFRQPELSLGDLMRKVYAPIMAAFVLGVILVPAVTNAETTVQESQALAIRLYPTLGVDDSPLNKRFVSEYNRLQIDNPDFFTDPSWPVILAKQCSDFLAGDNGTGDASAAAAGNAFASPRPDPSQKVSPLAAVVTITGSEGAGTGFICNYRGKTYVVTNQHVLEAGSPLTILTSDNIQLVPQQFLAATDEDLLLIKCASIPSNIRPLEIEALPNPSIQDGNDLNIPGNSKGDGVITQTSGKLLAIGPQQVEVDNPIYQGNSGSPIIDVASGKVIGVLTYATLVTLTPFETQSFQSSQSSIKSRVRYFGYRIDAVRKWEYLDWQTFQQNQALINQSQEELEDIFAFFNGSSDQYKTFQKLVDAWKNASITCSDGESSVSDKVEAYNRFLRDVAFLARTAKTRVGNRNYYFCQTANLDVISQMSDTIHTGVADAGKNEDFERVLFRRGGY